MFLKLITNLYYFHTIIFENIYNMILFILDCVIVPFYFLLNIIYKNNSHKIDVKNNNKMVLHNNIYTFFKNLSNKWKYNNINDINLICDILYLYNKYNKPYSNNLNIFYNNINNINENRNTEDMNILDEHMKYYILGWYMYQNIYNTHDIE